MEVTYRLSRTQTRFSEIPTGRTFIMGEEPGYHIYMRIPNLTVIDLAHVAGSVIYNAVSIRTGIPVFINPLSNPYMSNGTYHDDA